MKQLKNIAHSFDLEIGETGFTVRKGRKAYEKCKLGEIIELWEYSSKNYDDAKYCGTGEIIHATILRFREISDDLLEFQHNKKCRDREYLKKLLKLFYGSMKNVDIVTLLFYKRLSKEKNHD